MSTSIPARAVLGVALAIALVAAAARPAAADTLADARARFDALRYDEALHLLDRAWHAGGNDPARLAAIFELAGRAAASMGRTGAARLWFQRWLSLEPDAALPAGTSPRLLAALADARAGLGGAALAVRFDRRGDRLELRVEDPLGLAAAVRLGTARAPIEDGRATLPAPPEPAIAATPALELLDLDGNVLLVDTRTVRLSTAPLDPVPYRVAAPLVAGPAPERRLPPPPGRAWHQRWPTWAYVAGGCIVIAVVAHFVDADAAAEIEEDPSTERVRTLETRRDVATWTFRGALLGTGIAATLGVVAYVRGRHRVAPAPPPGGGAGVAWTVAF